MRKLKLKWMGSGDREWHRLMTLNLAHPYFNEITGVYIIWSAKKNRAIRIGSGIIKDRIAEHKNNDEIKQYPDLYVTWAETNTNQMENIEIFLAEALKHLVGTRFPDKDPIEVNLPPMMIGWGIG